MPADTAMAIDVRRTYLAVMQQRYRGATKQQCGQLLDEMEEPRY